MPIDGPSVGPLRTLCTHTAWGDRLRLLVDGRTPITITLDQPRGSGIDKRVSVVIEAPDAVKITKESATHERP